MKYIFLDIDGVIRINELWCKDCISVWNEIVETTQAGIIISSDWRYDHSLPELQRLFKKENISGVISNVIKKNLFRPFFQFEDARASKIKEFIKQHHLDDYLIIDDLDLTNKGIPEGRFVKTNSAKGLKEPGLKERCISVILNQKNFTHYF